MVNNTETCFCGESYSGDFCEIYGSTQLTVCQNKKCWFNFKRLFIMKIMRYFEKKLEQAVIYLLQVTKVIHVWFTIMKKLAFVLIVIMEKAVNIITNTARILLAIVKKQVALMVI